MMKLALLCLATSVLSEPPPLLHRPPEAEFDAITIDLKVRRKEAGPLLDHLAAAHISLVASGSARDYPDTSDLQQRIADAGELWSSDVAISVMDRGVHGRCQARSHFCVTVTATLMIPRWRQRTGGGALNPRAARATVRRSLKANIGTAASASAWLDITVEADPVIVGFTCNDWGGDIDTP